MGFENYSPREEEISLAEDSMTKEQKGMENQRQADYEKEKEKGIRGAKSFKELVDFIEKIDGLQGSGRLYKSVDLMGSILMVREGKADVASITRAGGLREKVVELLGNKETENIKIKKGLSGINSINELKVFLNEMMEVSGERTDDKVYSAKKLIGYIEQAELGSKGDLNVIPNTGGLKDKVKELLKYN